MKTVAIQNYFNSSFAKRMVSLSEETWNLLKQNTKKCKQKNNIQKKTHNDKMKRFLRLYKDLM